MGLDEDALEYHRTEPPGKIEISTTKPTNTQRDLQLAYSPGVAAPCRRINENPDEFREAYLSMLEADEDVAPDLFEEVDVDDLRAEIEVPEYETPELADREELDAHLEWMKTRDLIDGEADIGRIVARGR